MNNREFKSILHNCLEKRGFIRNKQRHYKITNNIIIVVDTQKSNYDNSYYINYAFFVKDIHDGEEYPKTTEGDVRGRFGYECEGKTYDYYNLKNINIDDLQSSFENNINNVLMPVAEYGIMKHFELFPKALYTATRKLKDYLDNNPR